MSTSPPSLAPLISAPSPVHAAASPPSAAPISFTDFPRSIHVNILSFLGSVDICAFACTCRRFAALCSPSSPSADLWFAICERRWGCHIQIRRWSSAPSPRLYKTLDCLEHLIGFWNRIDGGVLETPSLAFFEWGPNCIIGYRVSPSPFDYFYDARKVPFLWVGVSLTGEAISYHNIGCRFESEFADRHWSLQDYLSDISDVIPVTINIMGLNHFEIEDTMGDSKKVLSLEASSPPDPVLTEIYHYFTKRNTIGDSSSRQLKKMKMGRGSWQWKEEYFARNLHYCQLEIQRAAKQLSSVSNLTGIY